MSPKSEEKGLNTRSLKIVCPSFLLITGYLPIMGISFPGNPLYVRTPCSMNYLSKPGANCLLIQLSKLIFDSQVYTVILKKLI